MKKYLFILSALVLFVFSGCNKITLSGNNITKEFSIEGSYTELVVENAFDVTVSDAVDQITVTTDENVMPKVLVEKDGDKLKIHLKPLSINLGTDLELKVVLPYNADLTSVTLSGASTFQSSYGLSSENIQVELSGASGFTCNFESFSSNVTLSGASEFHGKVDTYRVNIKLSGASDYFGDIQATEVAMDLEGGSNIEGKVYASNLRLEMSGASDATLEGDVTHLDIDLSGSSNIVKTVVNGCYGLTCYDCKGKMSGASEAYIHCNDNITVDLSGGSDLHFTGNAFTGDCTTSGGSHIIHEVNP